MWLAYWTTYVRAVAARVRFLVQRTFYLIFNTSGLQNGYQSITHYISVASKNKDKASPIKTFPEYLYCVPKWPFSTRGTEEVRN